VPVFWTLHHAVSLFTDVLEILAAFIREMIAIMIDQTTRRSIPEDSYLKLLLRSLSSTLQNQNDRRAKYPLFLKYATLFWELVLCTKIEKKRK
jgi:hypothetical protein